MLRTQEEWYKFALERGTDGSMVFDILKDWKEETEWFSVKDRLPGRGERFLVVLSNPKNPRIRLVDTAIFDKSRQHFNINCGLAQVGYRVDLWRPFPQPPKE